MASGGTSPFSQRLIDHPLVNVDAGKTGLLAVKNQLLIRQSQQPAVSASLTAAFKKAGLKGGSLVPVASLLSGGPVPLVISPADDVVLHQVIPPPHASPNQTDVFDLTAQIRSDLNEKDPLISSVSPNHILIPESNIDWCPKGPPGSRDGRARLEPQRETWDTRSPWSTPATTGTGLADRQPAARACLVADRLPRRTASAHGRGRFELLAEADLV